MSCDFQMFSVIALSRCNEITKYAVKPICINMFFDKL